MNRQSHLRARRGILLVEVICWLPLMAALLALTGEMMVSGLTIYRQNTARDVMIGRVDSALDTLRRDVWRAESIQTIKDQVALTEPEGAVLWRMENGKILTRIDGTGPLAKKTWIDMPAFTVMSAGPLLQVDGESGPGGARRESMTMASQRMLAGGAP